MLPLRLPMRTFAPSRLTPLRMVTEPLETSRSLPSVTPESVPPESVARSLAAPEAW